MGFQQGYAVRPWVTSFIFGQTEFMWQVQKNRLEEHITDKLVQCVFFDISWEDLKHDTMQILGVFIYIGTVI